MKVILSVLAHRPCSRRTYRSRMARETAVLSTVLAVLAAWPWSPDWPLAARVLLGVLYGSVAVASAATMRRKP